MVFVTLYLAASVCAAYLPELFVCISAIGYENQREERAWGQGCCYQLLLLLLLLFSYYTNFGFGFTARNISLLAVVIVERSLRKWVQVEDKRRNKRISKRFASPLAVLALSVYLLYLCVCVCCCSCSQPASCGILYLRLYLYLPMCSVSVSVSVFYSYRLPLLLLLMMLLAVPLPKFLFVVYNITRLPFYIYMYYLQVLNEN